jgi:hypothetical protein
LPRDRTADGGQQCAQIKSIRTADQAGRRVDEFQNNCTPTGPDNPQHLAQAFDRFGKVPQAERDGGRVKGSVVEWQFQGVALYELHAGMVATRHLEHLRAEIEADHSAPWSRDARQLGRQLARAASDIQRRAAGGQTCRTGRAPPPTSVGPAGEHGVDQVVPVRNAVEHRADGLGITLSDVD